MRSPVRVWSRAFFSKMEEEKIGHKRHVFVCVNEREQGDCCRNVNGLEVFTELKQFVKDNGLKEKVKVTRTGCMGFCNDTGCTVAIYPESIWLKKTTLKDVQKIKDLLCSNI